MDSITPDQAWFEKLKCSLRLLLDNGFPHLGTCAAVRHCGPTHARGREGDHPPKNTPLRRRKPPTGSAECPEKELKPEMPFNDHRFSLHMRRMWIEKMDCPRCGAAPLTPCIGIAGIFEGTAMQVCHGQRVLAAHPEWADQMPLLAS